MKKGLYYLQLQVNVFDSDEFKLIKSQEDGNMLQYLYLRLLTKSLPTNGRLVFNDTRAFTPTSISKIFDLPLKLVETGWSVFQELGLLVEIEKDINDLPIMGLYSFKEYIGTLTPDAERKRIQRQKEDKKVLMDAKAKRKPIKSTFIDIESIPDACPKLSQICPEMTSELEIDTEQQKYQKVESNIELNNIELNSVTEKESSIEKEMHIDKEQQIKRNIASEKETTTEANIKTETVIGISAEMDSCNSGFSFEEKPVEYLGTVLDENTILKKDIETVKENLYQLNPLDDDLTYDPSHEEIVSYLKELLLVKCNSLQASKLKDDINYYLNTSVYIRDLYCNFTHWKKGIEYMIDLLHNRRIALRILDKELGDEDRDFMVKYFYSARVMEKNEKVKYLFVSEKYVKDQNKGSQSFEEWFKAMQVKAGEFFHSCVSSNILGAYLTVLYQDPEYACFQDMNTGDLDTFQHVDLLLKTYPEFKIQDFARSNCNENKNYNMRDEIMKSCYEKTIEYVKDNIFPKTKQQELQNDMVPKSNEIYKTSQENKVELDICIKGAA